ncbi:MAG: hypothetical protein KDA52_14030, partial [Planctomycetaceae bacterium]|nr:hypothetical protein [Planctomycetaceae bacterium]
MSTENSVTPPVESASTVPDSPVSSHDADSPQPETPVVEAVEEQQPADATSQSEPASTASASGEAQQDSGSTTPDEPRRRVQLNPTLDPKIAKPVPSIAPQASAPMETGVVAEAAASAVSSSEQTPEVTEQPADVQAVQEASPVEAV